MFLCHASASVISGEVRTAELTSVSQEEGDPSSTRSTPASASPPRDTEAGVRPNELAAAEADLSPRTPPGARREGIAGERPGNHVVLDCCQLYKVDQQKMAQPTTSPDTLAVPEVDNPHGPNPWLNEDLVKSLRENLLQHEKPKPTRKSVSPKLSPVISPRNSPRLLRRMLLSSNIPKQRRFTVAHTW